MENSICSAIALICDWLGVGYLMLAGIGGLVALRRLPTGMTFIVLGALLAYLHFSGVASVCGFLTQVYTSC